MKFVTKLFSEDSEVSCMRFMSIISLFVGAGIAFVALYKNQNLSDSASVIGIFVGSAFGGKIGQKFAEIKQEVTNVNKN